MDDERRRTPRYPFAGSIEMREGASEIKRTARVTELSMNGCYAETENPYLVGTQLGIKLFAEAEFFEAQATVVYSTLGKGMGLMFRETKPFFLTVLRKWLLAAMMKKKVIPG
jgi:hypothetical protein